MVEELWERLAQQVEVIPEHDYSLPLPTPAQLDAFEIEFHFRLPLSYRAFCLRFGAGWLGEFFQIASPSTSRVAPWWNLQDLNRFFKSCHSPEDIAFTRTLHVTTEEEKLRVVEHVQRLIFFCTLEGEEFIGWDREHVTDPKTHEYGIYVVPRQNKPFLCTTNFVEFIYNHCMGEKFLEVSPEDPDSWKSRDCSKFYRK